MRHSADRGLTLVEIMIVAAIFIGIGATLVLSLIISQRSSLSADAYIQVQEEARKALDNIVAELREARVNNDVDVSNAQQLDLQIARQYVAGGIEWGSENDATEWIHYAVDTGNRRLMRCVTLGKDDSLTGYAGCRVLANNVDSTDTSFDYDNTLRMVTIRIRTEVQSQQLPGGSMGISPDPLTAQVRLRNPA